MSRNSSPDLGEHFLTHRLLAGDVVMERAVGSPTNREHHISEAHPRGKDFGAKVDVNGGLLHASIIGSTEHIASTFESIPQKNQQGQNRDMAPRKKLAPTTVVDWPYHQAWCEAVAAYREGQDITNKEVAERLGISLSYLSAIIGRQKIPSMEVIIQAAYVFGSSPATFTSHPGLLAILARGSIDPDVHKAIIASVEYVLQESRKILTPVQKSMLISNIYNAAFSSHGSVDLPTLDEVRNLVRWG